MGEGLCLAGCGGRRSLCLVSGDLKGSGKGEWMPRDPSWRDLLVDLVQK